AAVYGPQKGASPEQVEELERRLAELGLPDAERPGAGAGGGIGGMLMALGATAVAGAGAVLGEGRLGRRLDAGELCITTEGRIDAQTLRGRVVSAVGELCASAGVACTAVGGQVEAEAGAELVRRGLRVLEQGDLAAAGRALAVEWA